MEETTYFPFPTDYVKIMKNFLKRLLKAAISVAIIAALVAFRYKVDKDLPWEQVITVKFLILAAIHIIPAYVIVWALGDDNLFLAESFAIYMPILIIWYALLGIVWAIFHSWLHLF